MMFVVRLVQTARARIQDFISQLLNRRVPSETRALCCSEKRREDSDRFHRLQER